MRLIVGLGSLLVVVVACSSESSSSGSSPAPGDGAPFGCCAIPSTPPSCTIRFGRAKQSDDDNCIDGYDGMVPDPNADGWTQTTDADGCPKWVAPANAPRICCGCVNDSGMKPVDGGADSEADSSVDASDAATD